MVAFYYAAVALMTAYLLLTIWRFKKVPKSISDTYYQWAEVGTKYLFTFVMWAVGILILIYWVSKAELCKCQFLAFTSVSGMCFVGAACAFKETLTRATHFTSAGIWAASALLFFIINGMFMPIMVGGIAGLIALFSDKFNHYTFWAELACVIMMIVGIGIL